MKQVIKASDLFIKSLEAEGVQMILGIPGEENLALIESLSKSETIQLVLTRHEQAAGFMAATYGRLTGKAGVCLSTLGPGATNLTTAAAYATLGGMPMMMITGQKPVKRSKQGRFQILDVVEMMKPITKYARQLVSVDNIPSRVREALRLAEEEKPGAVHLELPEDIAEELTSERPIPASYVRRPITEDKAITAAVHKIATARSPILVIGAGGNRKMTCRMLTELVDTCQIPFVTTQLGKGVIDERHPLFLGCAALSAGDFVHRAIEEADLIVNIGHDVIEKPPFFMHPGTYLDGVAPPIGDDPVGVSGATEVIHVNFRSAEVDPVYFPQLEVVGDIANAVWRIKNGLLERGLPEWDFQRMMTIKRHHDDSISQWKNEATFPISPPQLVHDIRTVMPEDGILRLKLKPGQSIRADAGTMNYMSSDIDINTKTGNVLGAFGRILSGTSFFYNIFTNKGNRMVHINLSGINPGNIGAFYIPKGQSLNLISSSYICSTPNLKISSNVRLGGLLTGYGISFVNISATETDGIVWGAAFGNVIEKIIKPGDSLVIDNGVIMGFEANIEIHTDVMRGFTSMLFSGEGLVSKITNNNTKNLKMFLQSRSKTAYLSYLKNKLKK